MICPTLLETGRKVNNYIADATDTGAGNLKFDSTTVATFTVPTGKRWYLLAGLMNRDVSGTCTITIKDTADKIINILSYAAAGTGKVAYPQQASNQQHANLGYPMILNVDEYVHILLGAAQGAGAYASCVVIEVDV